MRNFVHILIYLVVQVVDLIYFDLNSRTTYVQTIRLFISLRIHWKHGLKLPPTLLNEPICVFWE